MEYLYRELCKQKKQGYTGKMYLDQGWLTQQTSDSVFWRLTATFQNEVKEFKASYFVVVFLLKHLILTLFKVIFALKVDGSLLWSIVNNQPGNFKNVDMFFSTYWTNANGGEFVFVPLEGSVREGLKIVENSI